MAPFDEGAVLDLGRNPIPDGTPCGVDVGDDPRYLLVTAELDKLDRIESQDPNWYQIEQDAVSVLGNSSKDIEIAAALGHALFKQHGYAGLAAALGLLTGLINNFWDGLYPGRPRRRKARIEALANRFVDGAWFRENQPKSDEFDSIELCVSRTEELKSALLAQMPDDPSDFARFSSGLKELAARRPKPGTPSAPGPGTPGASYAADQIADARGAVSALMTASTYLRKADPSDPIPYVVVRCIKWSNVVLPASDAARTEIEPPEASIVEALKQQFADGVWDHLLNSAEAAFRSNDPLWLDVQCYLCAAMSGLGENYERAREAVAGLAAGLVRRLGDGLYELQFRNGSPLCSAETKIWLKSETAQASGESRGAASSQSNGRLADACEKARKLVGAGKLREGVKELQEGYSACTQRRDRLLWRLRMALLCLNARRTHLASPLLDECYEEIRRYHIDEWEPNLAVEVAQALYRCRKSITTAVKQPAQEALQGVRESFAWLCQLDPLAALEAEPSNKSS